LLTKSILGHYVVIMIEMNIKEQIELDTRSKKMNLVLGKWSQLTSSLDVANPLVEFGTHLFLVLGSPSYNTPYLSYRTKK
jgi:hypothetical protein